MKKNYDLLSEYSSYNSLTPRLEITAEQEEREALLAEFDRKRVEVEKLNQEQYKLALESKAKKVRNNEVKKSIVCSLLPSDCSGTT